MSRDIPNRSNEQALTSVGLEIMREAQERATWVCEAVRGPSVLDVGCKQGLVAILLGREGKSVVGMDNDARAIKEAESSLAQEPTSVRRNVSFVQAEFAAHTFRPDERFDAVVMGEILSDLVQPARFVAAAAALLEEHGQLIATFPFGVNDRFNHRHTYYLLEPYALLAERFEIVDIKVFGKWLGLSAVKSAAASAQRQSSWLETRFHDVEAAFKVIERGLLDEVSAWRSKFDDANGKYQASAGESNKLRRDSAHHESERKHKELAAAELERRLVEAEKLFELRLAESQAQFESLRREIENHRAARHEGEIAVVRLEERLNHTEELRRYDRRLNDAELARVQDDAASLKRAAEVSAKQLAETQSQLLQDGKLHQLETHAKQGEILRLHAKVEVFEAEAARAGEAERSLKEAVSAHEREVAASEAAAARLDRELAEARGRIDDAQRAHLRELQEADMRYTQELTTKEAECQRFRTELAKVQREADVLDFEQNRANQAVIVAGRGFVSQLRDELSMLRRLVESRVENVEKELLSAIEERSLPRAGRHPAHEELEALRREAAEKASLILELEARLRRAESALDPERSELTRLRATALDAEAALVRAQSELTEMRATVAADRIRAEEFGQLREHENRAATSSQHAWLAELDQLREQARLARRDLDTQRALTRDGERKAEQVRLQLLDAKRAERLAVANLEKTRRDKLAAEKQADQARRTLSFQLGYQLIHGFKSREALLALPKSLWSLHKEAARRRAKRATDRPFEQEKAAPFTASSVPTAGGISDVLPRVSAASAQTVQQRPSPPTSPSLSALRVASIVDEFSYSSFRPECNLQQLTPNAWRDELESFRPELLLVESAWRGKDDSWGSKVGHTSSELRGVVEWCNAHGVPTVFWNKEDPAHFHTFMNTAKLFDFVFTTDLDCIQRYRRVLGHDRVFLLPFACQPLAHNPIEKYARKDAIAFAGAYYARYPERQRDLGTLIRDLAEFRGVEIYDRNHGKDDPNYKFPDEYRPFIVGTLAFDEIDQAYKGYRYALNLNSIKQSQTMFARRAFELLASNTITISNFSRGLRLIFGDLIVTTDSGERAVARLRQLSSKEDVARRFRLAGLRKVLREHTYQDRLRYIASKVWQKSFSDELPRIVMVAYATSDLQLRAILENYGRQSYPHKKLVLVAPSDIPLGPLASGFEVRRLAPSEARAISVLDAAGEGSHVATLVSEDHYGSNYLMDLALATRYVDAAAVGKAARYVLSQANELVLREEGSQYKFCASLPARSALIKRGELAAVSLGDWLSTVHTRQLERPTCFAIDEFNFCQGGWGRLSTSQAAQIEDLCGLDAGVSLSELVERAEQKVREHVSETPARQIGARELSALLKVGGKPIELSLEGDALVVNSSLPDEKHEYIYAHRLWSPADLAFTDSGKFHLAVTPGLNLQAVLVFLDDKRERLGNKVFPAGHNETVTLPPGTSSIRLGLRVYGAGSAKVSGLVLGHVSEAPDALVGRSKYLLLANHYPSDADLYRNAFVHRRVLDYVKHGVKVDVFRLRPKANLSYHEFDGIDVITGSAETLARLLTSNDYEVILVHFLDQQMASVLREHAAGTKTLVWVHGAEIQPWHRRQYDYESEVQLETAKKESAKRTEFWREVPNAHPNAKLIFVSRHFANEAIGDLGQDLPSNRYEVIHNVVDGELFAYRYKDPEQRKRILSIRPYASRKYANDLTVAAICELSKRPWFEELEFYLIGDGRLFDETVAPVRSFRNVRIHKGFLTQAQIAELHRHYGVFLCPTRWDSQGVSRDEAMASGLVPVTSNVAAVPEFVDASSGILAAPESPSELAEGIAVLYRDPDLFLRLSRQAASRVRSQSSPERTTLREIELICGQSLGGRRNG